MCICRLVGLLPKFVTWTSDAAEAGCGASTVSATAMSTVTAPRQPSIAALIFMRSPRSEFVGPGQETEQAVPLRAKDVGLAVFPVWVAWKPMLLTEVPGLMVALYDMLRAVI